MREIQEVPVPFKIIEGFIVKSKRSYSFIFLHHIDNIGRSRNDSVYDGFPRLFSAHDEKS